MRHQVFSYFSFYKVIPRQAWGNSLIKYEKTQAKKHRGEKFGGLGKPDYQIGQIKGEVKSWNQLVHSGVIKKAIKMD